MPVRPTLSHDGLKHCHQSFPVEWIILRIDAISAMPDSEGAELLPHIVNEFITPDCTVNHQNQALAL